MGARGLIILLLGLAAVRVQAAAAKVDFDRQIRPILSDKCYRCHGPDAASREADMRLDRSDGVPEDVLVPGKPGESELIARITSEDESERMPPPDSHLQLSAEEKALLAQWIQEGAEFTEHWSFRPLPARVEVPPVHDNELAAGRDRSFCAGPSGKGKVGTVAAGRFAAAPAPRDTRRHRPAADSRADSRL